MNALDHRIKRIEEAADNARGKRIAYCWIEAGEDEDAALAKWKQENGGEDPDLEVFVVRWANEGTWPPLKPQPEPGMAALSIDDEIEKLYGDLEEAGFSRAEVERMVKDGTALASEMKEGARPDPVTETEPQPEPMQPRRASELVGLFRKR